MKIAIIGAGALGSLFGGLLARSGEEVRLFDPIAKEHIAKINRDGLIIEEEGKEERVAVRATTSIEELGEAELVGLFVKAHQTEAALQIARPALGPSTLVLSLQNGLGLEQLMERHVPRGRLLRGVTAQGSTLLGPGRVRHAGRGPTWLGPVGQVDRAKLKAIVEAFNRAGIETHLEQDIARLVWRKLLINAGINALTAVFDVPNGELVADPELREIMRAVVCEAIGVAQALGLDFPAEETIAQVEEVCRLTARNISSMLQDVRRGSPTEIDYINGAIVHCGEEVGISTPLNLLLTRLVKRLEGGRDAN
jgi:2-dehydropantoate 2-reductase